MVSKFRSLAAQHISRPVSNFGSIVRPRTASCSAAFSRSRRLLGLIALAGALLGGAAYAQAPIALPYTMTTIAGLTPMSSTAGTQCPNLPTGVVSTDAYGDGCLAINGIFGAGVRGGVQVDSFGNVFVADDINSIAHVINPTTGIMTVLAGKGTLCTTGKLDSAGDGCLAATQTVLSSPRGIGIDPWGNVLLSGYGDNMIHMVCRAASPNCTAAQIGYMELVAGCVSGTSGATSGVGLDNHVAKSTGVTCTTSLGEVNGPRGMNADAYGNIYYADTGTSRTRVVVGPLTSPYFSGNNPLYAALGVYWPTVTQGYVYTIANINGSGTSTPGTWAMVKGNTCSVTTNSVTYTGTVLDTTGDGCPFEFSSVVASSGYTNTVAADAAGNAVFTDPTSALRVFYVSGNGTAGAAMKAAIIANNPGVTPQAGFLYSLWGFPGSAIATATLSGGTITGITVTNGGSGYTSAPAVTLDFSTACTTAPGAATATISGGAVTGITVASAGAGCTVVPVVEIAGGGGTALGLTPTLGTGTASGNSAITKVTVSPQGNIYIGDSSMVLSYDIGTGYIRELFVGSSQKTLGAYCNGSTGQKSLSAYSDGCAASQSLFTTSSGLGIAVDGQNNLYLQDATTNTVRKVLAQGFAPRVQATTQIQNFQIHVPETSAGSVSSLAAALSTTPDDTVGALTCGAQNNDFSFDCNVPVTSTPVVAGLRSAALTATVPFTGTSTTTAVADLQVGGTVTGSALALDVPTASSGTQPTITTNTGLFSGITPAGVALDGAANIYVMDTTSRHFLEYVGGSSVALPGTLPTTPSQIAVDKLGDVFAVGSGTSTITELAVSGAPSAAGQPSTYTATSVAYTPTSGTAAPQAIAVDGFGNLFVADVTTETVYQLSLNPGNQITVATGFTNPVSLAVDPSGNVYVADKGAGIVYKLTPGLNSGVPGYVKTSFLTGVVPVAVATDAAGDVYVQDSTSGHVIDVPVSGPNTVVYTGLTTPAGLAVDGIGNVYSADTHNSYGITQVVRDAVSYNFGTSESTTFTGTLTDVGNQAITGQAIGAGINTTNFQVVGGASNPCTFNSNVLGAQASGNACTLSATLIGAGSGTVTDPITYLPAASTTGSFTLTGTLQGTAVATTTTITGQTPANPSYGSGTEVTFTVTVAAASGSTAPGGTVAVTVNSTTTTYSNTTNYSLTASGTSGVATVALSGLPAGSYTIYAAYATSGSFSASNSGTPQGFTIGQNATTTSWTPGTTTVQYGMPISTSALNAAATYNSTPVPGVYVYTANGTEVNAATYLAIGTYPLAVTFYPTDSVDYTSSTASGGTFTVTKATTTAPVGATQNLVAADGTGNFTTVQSALNTLSPTGGSIYIKPGSYTGFVTVITPNTSIYGLGGVPSNVILTNEDGAFSSPFLPGQGVGNNGSSGDEGSSTMVVARASIAGYNGGATTTPYNFYAENFTIQNTYDTDTTNSNPNYYISGSCVGGNAGLPNATLFNGAGTSASPGLCNSQALAIWITGDQAVMNNIYTASLQDTIYAGSVSASSGYAARQYWFRGKVTGNVDYIFGDAAAVFDHTTIYTMWHGTSAGGEETIEAQNKAAQTGSSNDYLSGYIMNSDVFTSQSSGMTGLYFGRNYGIYSTWVMLNSYIDQVIPTGYTAFNPPPLTNSTYVEYNDHTYTDPSTGSPDANGVPYLGTGGSSGTGVLVNGTTVVRETLTTNPGTIEAASNGFQTNFPSLPNTTLSQIEAQQYYPIAFLGTTVATNPYNNGVTSWNPTTAIATGVNGFVPSATSASVASGSSVTILMRPHTPGLGAVTNGVYTIPTGTYTLYDTFNGGAQYVVASGSLDASGEAYFTSSSLNIGTHNLVWNYSGDSNFTGSTTGTAYVLTVTGSTTATTVALTNAATPITYGQSSSVTATVASTSGTPAGNVTLYVDGAVSQTKALTSGAVSFTITGLTTATHALTASYAGNATYSPSSTTANTTVMVSPATLTISGNCPNRLFDTPNVCTATVSNTYQYSDSAATVFTGTPTVTVSALRNSPAGTYTATPVYTLTTFGATNYTVNPVVGQFNVNGNTPQTIIFPPLPNFTHGATTYQLTARTTSGLPVTYTVTAGPATVSGSTLSVTGTGTVTIQASQATDPTTDYAAATPVSRSFTAQ